MVANPIPEPSTWGGLVLSLAVAPVRRLAKVSTGLCTRKRWRKDVRIFFR